MGEGNGLRAAAKRYYAMTKPGIVQGNDLTAAAGFLLAAHGQVALGAFLAMLAGLSLVMAGACVSNNYLDRGIDRKMKRTRERALASGTVGPLGALVFAAVLTVSGTAILLAWCNWLSAALAVFGFVAYVAIYGIAKRRSVHGTVIGSISGAVPPVVGYCAAGGRFDGGAWLLFLILVFWQMPHFYAIAMFRADDYQAAGIPVLPVHGGMQAAKRQTIIYVALFILACAALAWGGYAGWPYAVGAVGVGVYWLYSGLRRWHSADDIAWSRRMFGLSLAVLSVWSLAVAADSFLH